MSALTSDKPVITILTLAIAVIVVIAGAVVTIVNPDRLPFSEYIQDVSIVAGALGVGSGIGRGLSTLGTNKKLEK